MLDFTSALYLGLDHSSSSLPGWSQLTLGKPAVLEELEAVAQTERELAELTASEAALLGSSTLHLFWDLFGSLADPRWTILVDEGSYPIARWGTERAAAGGAVVRSFARHDVNALRANMASHRRTRPVVVTDGFSPTEGIAAPLQDYADCVAAQGGFMIVDDTQALGILGTSPDLFPPYGRGGGGSVARLARGRQQVVVVSSLAKAFGVPIAMLAGGAPLLDCLREHGSTRVHCSPPSAAVLAAAQRALHYNRHCGDSLRARLASRVSRFRRGLRELGIAGVPGWFPVQTLRLSGAARAESVHERLLRRGVRAVLHRGPGRRAPGISFIVTARHRQCEIDRALSLLAEVVTSASAARFHARSG